MMAYSNQWAANEDPRLLDNVQPFTPSPSIGIPSLDTGALSQENLSSSLITSLLSYRDYVEIWLKQMELIYHRDGEQRIGWSAANNKAGDQIRRKTLISLDNKRAKGKEEIIRQEIYHKFGYSLFIMIIHCIQTND